MLKKIKGKKRIQNIEFFRGKKSNVSPANFVIFLSLFLLTLLSLLVVSAIGSTNYNITTPTLSEGAGNLSSSNYGLDMLLDEIFGNMSSSSYNTELGFWYTIGVANTAPNTPTVSINSSDGSNKTAIDLNCFATVIDPDNNSMNVTVEWYNNLSLNLTLDYDNSYDNGTLFIATLVSGNTTKGEIWSCGLRLYDGQDYSAWSNSSNLTIVNTAPSVSLTAPADGNVTTNRTPMFSWSGSDDDADTLQYEINISCWEAGSIVTAGSVYKDITDIGTATSYTPAVGEYLKCLQDNNQNYNWSVRVYDGEEYSGWTTERNLSIQSLITISLPVSDVYFGRMKPGDSNDTADDSPAPLVLQNDGNAEVNISANFSDLFSTASNPSNYFKFKITNISAGCFAEVGTLTTWTQAPSTLTEAINRLNFTSGYQVGCSNVSVDLNITIPAKEPGGSEENKTSIATFISSLAEEKVS